MRTICDAVASWGWEDFVVKITQNTLFLVNQESSPPPQLELLMEDFGTLVLNLPRMPTLPPPNPPPSELLMENFVTFGFELTKTPAPRIGISMEDLGTSVLSLPRISPSTPELELLMVDIEGDWCVETNWQLLQISSHYNRKTISVSTTSEQENNRNNGSHQFSTFHILKCRSSAQNCQSCHQGCSYLRFQQELHFKVNNFKSGCFQNCSGFTVIIFNFVLASHFFYPERLQQFSLVQQQSFHRQRLHRTVELVLTT